MFNICLTSCSQGAHSQKTRVRQDPYTYPKTTERHLRPKRYIEASKEGEIIFWGKSDIEGPWRIKTAEAGFGAIAVCTRLRAKYFTKILFP